MRVRTWAVVALAALAGFAAAADRALAQENPSPEQMKKMYDDALQQLKAAQERKNQLAAENEKLGQQLEAARKELSAAHGRLEELKRADAEHAEKTFFLRSHYMAWQQFARMYPETAGRWRTFLEGDYLSNPREGTLLIDRDWPTGSANQPATRPAGTQPSSTQPAATQPAGTQPSTTQPVTTQPVKSPPTGMIPLSSPPPTAPPPTQPASQPATLPAGPAVASPPTTNPATVPTPPPAAPAVPPAATQAAGTKPA